jgi:hypothetical protein
MLLSEASAESPLGASGAVVSAGGGGGHSHAYNTSVFI